MRVLTVCNPLTSGYRLDAILEESQYSVTSVANTDDGGTLTEENAYDLILLEIPTVGKSPGDFIKGLRWSGSPCQRAIVIALAGPEHLDEAEELLDEGVSRIINPAAPEHILRSALEEAVAIDERFAVNAFVRIPGEDLGLRGTLMTQTIDVSSSGMMVRVTKEVRIGVRFSFALTLPGVPKAIEGKAEAIRLKTIGMGRIQGFAAIFSEFSGDGQRRLDDFIKKRPPTH